MTRAPAISAATHIWLLKREIDPGSEDPFFGAASIGGGGDATIGLAGAVDKIQDSFHRRGPFADNDGAADRFLGLWRRVDQLRDDGFAHPRSGVRIPSSNESCSGEALVPSSIPPWLQFSFPTRWHYDVLRGLEHFCAAGVPPDSRVDEAMDLLRLKQQPDTTWFLENTHPGGVHLALEEGDGRPSRWNRLCALRVLGWHEQ